MGAQLSTGQTKIMRIVGTSYEVEETPGGFALWGPCSNRDEECESCGGTGEQVLAFCGRNERGGPEDPDMVKRVTGLESFDFERIQ